MSSPIASKLDSALVNKAVSALLAYERKKISEKKNGKASLVSDYSKPILVQIQLTKEISKPVSKPVRVKIPHIFFNADEEDNTICFFCRSEDKASLETYFESNPVPGLTKVLSLNDVKKSYASFKDKKELMNAHTHFMSDARISHHLYNLLGPVFKERNTYPIQINFTKNAELPGHIQKAADSTHFHFGGRNLTIRFGMTHMSADKIAENVLAGLPFAIQKLPNDWKDVHSIQIKSNDSPALPVYSKVPDQTLDFVKNTEIVKKTSEKAVKTPAKKEDKKEDKKEAVKTPVAAVKAEEPKSVAKPTKTPSKTPAKEEKKETPAAPVTPAAASTAAPVTASKKSAKKAEKEAEKEEAEESLPVPPVVEKSAAKRGRPRKSESGEAASALTVAAVAAIPPAAPALESTTPLRRSGRARSVASESDAGGDDAVSVASERSTRSATKRVATPAAAPLTASKRGVKRAATIEPIAETENEEEEGDDYWPTPDAKKGKKDTAAAPKSAVKSAKKAPASAKKTAAAAKEEEVEEEMGTAPAKRATRGGRKQIVNFTDFDA